MVVYQPTFISGYMIGWFLGFVGCAGLEFGEALLRWLLG